MTKEENKAYQEQYREKNRAKLIQTSAQWYLNNKAKAIQNNRLWRENNREKYLATAQKYNNRHKVVIDVTIPRAVINRVLRENPNHYLYDKEVEKWTEKDLNEFNKLLTL